ncbi:hypothetical protein GGR54DRAFT_591654 [Hypoxylon sp. NC1633]|nr:hypothetical protein GGR54DRAFT_591654 [Hypoxylon sp. NC1633]
MSTHIRLSPAECDLLFTPALGAFVLSGGLGSRLPSYDTIGSIISASSGEDMPYLGYLNDFQVKKLTDALHINTIISLGTACFGFVFERYKKKAAHKDHLGQAFGLTPTRAEFSAQFPDAKVDKWQGTSPSDYWFSSMLRNAFAHAQWEIIDHFDLDNDKNGDQRVRLWNVYNNQITFDITLTLTELRDIIVAALFNFITYVQEEAVPWPQPPSAQPGSHVMLFRLLREEILFGNMKTLYEEDGRRVFFGVDLLREGKLIWDVAD